MERRRAITVLLTGGTGFLGTQVARQLLAETDCELLVLVRAPDPAGATHRLARAWWDWPQLAGTIGARVEVLNGDVSLPCLGLPEDDYRSLTRRVTHIIHTAADLRMDAPIDELRKANVGGTAHILALARAVHREHGLGRLSHVSTAYVAGGRSGVVPEEALTAEFGFSCAYEASKYEAEELVQAAKVELPISVLRPGIIVGDSTTGEIKTFNALYIPLRFLLSGLFWLLPARADQPVNMVPVDYVAQAIVRLTFEPRAEGLNFHLTAPFESLPTAGELVEVVRGWARQRLGLRLPKPLFVPLPLPRGRYRLGRRASRGSGAKPSLITLLPYFGERLQFRRENTDRLLGPYPLRWQEFLPCLLDYAARKSLRHRSDRTVHEQILHRLEHTRRPIRLFDIVAGRPVLRTAGDVCREMLAAAGALRALGIGPGDRVALVGLNSTRYLILDVAIGLVGATSVPLSDASPPPELNSLLKASGTRVLFVGAPKLLQQVDELKVGVPVISFCRESAPMGGLRPVMNWDTFLNLGGDAEATPIAPVSLGSLATLRYAVDIPGRPRGVMFRHNQVRWMGECVASLVPWRARNRRARWLSYLPMDPGGGGILAAYAPYYLPAPVDIYFPEDLASLRQALPVVRPTMFVSEPELYEQVWERLCASRLGQRYAKGPGGAAKRVLRSLVRWHLLKEIGLAGCSRLVVSSAPVSERLVRAFHELGIEIQHGYGLAEAPLVTISRGGAGRPGTAGEPLPETEVRIAENGEVLVRGPQVTAGYDEQGADSPVRDGWLFTGDLGYLTGEGNLILVGRKRETGETV